MVEHPLSTIFGFIGTFYGLVVPLLVVLGLSILFIASMHSPGAKAKEVGSAIYCYAMHGVSVILMTIGALPTVFSVFAGIAYTGRTYIALLLVFACGGLLFLIQDASVRELDKASKAVPEAIYMTTVKFIGNLLAMLAALTIFLSIVLASYSPGWWVTPFVLLLYGLLLSWCTKEDGDLSVFQTLHMEGSPARARAKGKSSTKRKK
jgi:hypothetical protein